MPATKLKFVVKILEILSLMVSAVLRLFYTKKESDDAKRG